MTKLEEKLIELGYYRNYEELPYVWEKEFNNHVIVIYTSQSVDGWVSIGEEVSFRSQQYINNLQQVFDKMNEDVKELKKYED